MAQYRAARLRFGQPSIWKGIPDHIGKIHAIGKALRQFNLKPAKKIQSRFDPFHENVTSIREFLLYTSPDKYRMTNPKCAFKTDVCNDRSEPTINITLENKQEVILKTANLSCLELLQLFNKHVSSLDKSAKEEVEVPSTKKKTKSRKK